MCRPDTGNRGGVRMHMEEITKDTGGGYGGGGYGWIWGVTGKTISDKRKIRMDTGRIWADIK